MKIIKSDNDNRKYKYIKLNNNLEVLLIRDTNKANKGMASASMSVGVGSFDEKIEGLAHFLEHMLFMGSKKYPFEHDYFSFISKNGGYSNAYTQGDHTCYFFSINPKALIEALDIFAQFFISPLLSRDGIKREMNAVNSEHRKNINNDMWRTRTMIGHCFQPDNPLAKFTCGSLETLDVPDIYEQMLKFYKFYSANIMKLVISCGSCKSFDELEKHVQNSFSAIKNSNIVITRNYNKPMKQVFIEIVPISSTQHLNIVWDVLAYKELYDLKPYEFISYLIGYEGPNSMIEYLKNNGLMTKMTCGILDQIGTRALYHIDISLTEKGFLNVKYVHNVLHNYFTMIKKFIQNDNGKDKLEELYTQLKNISKKSFTEYQIDDEMDYVQNLSSMWSTTNISVNKILSARYLFPEYNAKFKSVFLDVMNQFNKTNEAIVVASPHFRDKTTHTEKWFSIKYNMFDIDKFSLKNKDTITNTTMSFSIPSKNKYIVYDTPMITEIKYMDNPVQLKNIYWKFDNRFGPQINIMLSMTYPEILADPLIHLIFVTYQNCLKFIMNPYIYESAVAGTTILRVIRKNCLLLDINGDSKTIESILKTVIDSSNIVITENVFDAVLLNIKNELENEKTSSPYGKIKNIIKKQLESDFYDHDELLKVINNIKFSDMQTKFKFTGVLCLIQGNINESDVNNLIKYVPVSTITEKINNIIIKPDLKKVILGSDGNSVASVLFHIGYINTKTPNWKKTIVLLELLNMIIGKSFFNSLRTKQQLGYIVKSGYKKYGHINNPYYVQFFDVQSDHKSCDYLIEMIDIFLKQFGNVSGLGLSDDEFSTYKKSLAKIFTISPNSLNQATLVNFEAIIRYDSIFWTTKLFIEEINIITLNDIVLFYKSIILNGIKNIVSIKKKSEI